MNTLLKLKILQSGQSQIHLAHGLGISDGYLSKIIKGWIDPKPELKEKIAAALGVQVSAIFPTQVSNIQTGRRLDHINKGR